MVVIKWGKRQRGKVVKQRLGTGSLILNLEEDQSNVDAASAEQTIALVGFGRQVAVLGVQGVVVKRVAVDAGLHAHPFVGTFNGHVLQADGRGQL